MPKKKKNRFGTESALDTKKVLHRGGRVSYKSMFFLTQSMLPLLKNNANNKNPARIINIGSIDGINKPEFNNYSYSAAKSAVHHMTRVLAAELPVIMSLPPPPLTFSIPVKISFPSPVF